MFAKGDTAISGVWVEPEPFAAPKDGQSADRSAPNSPRREPIAYVVQDSDRDPALVAVFGLGDPTSPRLLAPLIIEDPNSLIALAYARSSKASGAAPIDDEAPIKSAGLSLDMEGIAACTEGVKLQTSGSGPPFYGRDFWIVCEGKGRLVDGKSAKGRGRFRRPNLLVQLAPNEERRSLAVTRVVELPDEVRREQEPQGFEGVAVDAEGRVYVAFQRGWRRAGDPKGHARIGRFDPVAGSWTFAHYPLDAYPAGAAGPTTGFEREDPKDEPAHDPEDHTPPEDAWVGISEITFREDGKLLLLERDNQRGDRAKVQRIYAIDVSGTSFRPSLPLQVLGKALIFDLIEEGVVDPRYAVPLRKPEGLGLLGPKRLLLLADDDGKRGSKKGTPFFVLNLR